jgi:hypothetical protein
MRVAVAVSGRQYSEPCGLPARPVTHGAIVRALALTLLVLLASLVSAGSAEAAFTKSTNSSISTATTDALENHLQITPGTAVRPGTATLTTTGSGASLSVDLGRIPDSRTISDVIRLLNTDSTSRTVNLAVLGGISSIAGLEFADGTTIKALAPATTYQLRVRTNAATAGSQTGAVSLYDAMVSTFLRRDLPLTTRQAPVAPTGLTATTQTPPTVQINLAWTASTSTGLGGYNIYRATAAAGPFTKINTSTVAGLSYADSTVTAGTRYYYRVRAIAFGVTPDLESPDSATVISRYPAAPTAVRIPAGTNPANYINLATRANVTAQADVPASAEVGDVVNIRISDGTNFVTATRALTVAGAQTVSITGINTTALNDGAMTLNAWITNGTATGASANGTATKDTVAAISSTYVAATATNPVNFINRSTGIAPGTATAGMNVPASSSATDVVSIRLTRGAGTVTRTGAGFAGLGTVTIAGYSTNGWTDGAVTVEGRVQDAAGNDSGWVVGTPATRDTVIPAAPNAARIIATAVNPIDYINIVTESAAGVQVSAAGTPVGRFEARLTVGANAVSGLATAAAGNVNVPVDSTILADTAVGGVAVAARLLDVAGNPSAWFNGNAATKDTIMPTAPNFNLVTFQNRTQTWRQDRVQGANGGVQANAQLRVLDYSDNNFYPGAATWDIADGAGNLGNINVDNGPLPRTLGYEVRDAAWNTLARICRYYTAGGVGVATTCP